MKGSNPPCIKGENTTYCLPKKSRKKFHPDTKQITYHSSLFTTTLIHLTKYLPAPILQQPVGKLNAQFGKGLRRAGDISPRGSPAIQ